MLTIKLKIDYVFPSGCVNYLGIQIGYVEDAKIWWLVEAGTSFLCILKYHNQLHKYCRKYNSTLYQFKLRKFYKFSYLTPLEYDKNVFSNV